MDKSIRCQEIIYRVIGQAYGLDQEANDIAARDLVERRACDETQTDYVVMLPKNAKYAQILKNFVVSKETANERIFLMKDLAAIALNVRRDCENVRLR